MMNLLQQVEKTFTESISAKEIALKLLPEHIVAAASMMVESLKSGNKILACGNGGSACDAEHFACELVNRFLIERKPLAAIALNSSATTLTAIANDYDYEQVFSKQVEALGKENDVLLAISTSGNSKNVLEAIKKAHLCGMKVVGLIGMNGGEVAKILSASDVIIRVMDESTPRIQEVHILVIHCLCELIEQELFSKKE